MKADLMATREDLAQALYKLDQFIEQMGESPKKEPFEKYPTLTFIIGHSDADHGARGVDPITQGEYAWWSQNVKYYLDGPPEHGVSVNFVYRDGIGIAGAYEKAREMKSHAVIELHYNSFTNPGVYGSEVLMSDEFDRKNVFEKELAALAQSAQLKLFDHPKRNMAGANRGVKQRPRSAGEAGSFALMQLTQRASILVEPFFGSNRLDAEIAERKRYNLIPSYIAVFRQWYDRHQAQLHNPAT